MAAASTSSDPTCPAASINAPNSGRRGGRLDVLDVSTGERRTWKEIVPPDPAGVVQVEPFVVSEDGATFVYSYRRLLGELELITGVR